MLELSIEQVGEARLRATFDRLVPALSDLRGAWPEVRKKFHEIELRLFLSEGATGAHGRWRDLSRDYARRKARRVPGKGILQYTGELRMSLTGVGDSDVRMEPLLFEERSAVWYGKYHAFGVGRLPRRRPVDLTERDAYDLAKIIRLHVFRRVEAVMAGRAA